MLDPWKLLSCNVGDIVLCTVIQARPGKKYRVVIAKNRLFGELLSESSHRVGDDLLARIVVLTEREVVLSTRLSEENR